MTARVFYELLAFNATDPSARVAAACAAADAAHRAAPTVPISLAPMHLTPCRRRCLRQSVNISTLCR